MDIRGYETIKNAMANLEGDIIVEPWPLNMGPEHENESDFDPNTHLADGDDVPFLEISFNDATKAAYILNALGRSGLMARHNEESSAKTPCLRVLGMIRDDTEHVTSLTLEDLSAQ